MVKIAKEVVEELLFFSEYKFPQRTVEDIVSNKPSVALLLMRRSENLSGDIDEIVLQMVYGNSRKPPGDETSPSQNLMKKDDENAENTLIGIWTPPNSLAKATALKLLFPNLSAPFRLPDFIPTPLYVAIGYDAFKAREVSKLSEQYPGQVMAYGFFTTDKPDEAQLIAKTMEEFESRTTPVTYTEKIVIQLIKENPECFLAFSNLNPSYVSFDAIVGEEDCKYFFPPGYNVPEVEVVTVKKKSRKRGRKHAQAANIEASVTTGDANVEASEVDHNEDENEEQDSDEERPDGSVDNDNDSVVGGTDKATSPLHEEKMQ